MSLATSVDVHFAFNEYNLQSIRQSKFYIMKVELIELL
jgi:hypothetical protein